MACQLGIASFGRLLIAVLIIALKARVYKQRHPSSSRTFPPSAPPTASQALLGVNPAGCAVAVFINVPPWGWWSKPTCAQPLTIIQPDGSWSANITTAASDTNATRIAALLVGTNYNQPCVLGDQNL